LHHCNVVVGSTLVSSVSASFGFGGGMNGPRLATGKVEKDLWNQMANALAILYFPKTTPPILIQSIGFKSHRTPEL